MPAQKPISREYRIYLALWRKAYLSGEEVKVQCTNFSMAVAMRQGMYRAIRPFRQGTLSDSVLEKASEKYVVYLEKGSDKTAPHFIIFKERKTLNELESMWDNLGIDEEDLLFGDERSANESLQKLLDDVGSDIPTRTVTPFYGRD